MGPARSLQKGRGETGQGMGEYNWSEAPPGPGTMKKILPSFTQGPESGPVSTFSPALWWEMEQLSPETTVTCHVAMMAELGGPGLEAGAPPGSSASHRQGCRLSVYLSVSLLHSRNYGVWGKKGSSGSHQPLLLSESPGERGEGGAAPCHS